MDVNDIFLDALDASRRSSSATITESQTSKYFQKEHPDPSEFLHFSLQDFRLFASFRRDAVELEGSPGFMNT